MFSKYLWIAIVVLALMLTGMSAVAKRIYDGKLKLEVEMKVQQEMYEKSLSSYKNTVNMLETSVSTLQEAYKISGAEETRLTQENRELTERVNDLRTQVQAVEEYLSGRVPDELLNELFKPAPGK
jgi:hypothetical protein